MPAYGCCESAMEDFCCSFVPKCNGNSNRILHHKGQRRGNNNTSVLPRRSIDMHCSIPYKTGACLGGFYRSLNKTVQPCPDGFFCPVNMMCIIPCALGALCSRTRPTNARKHRMASTKCKSEDSSGEVSPIQVNGKALCPGRGFPSICPRGSFCPNSSAAYECPRGHFCRTGSTLPTKCTIVNRCSKGTSGNTLYIKVPVVCACMILLFTVVYIFFKNRSVFVRMLQRHTSKVKPAKCAMTVDVANKIMFMAWMAKPILIPIEEKKPLGVRFKDVEFSSKDGKEILAGVCGTLEAGKVTGIMGPSGGGKTTLLNILSHRANYGKFHGSFEVNGHVHKDMRHHKQFIGVVPQDDVMHECLTPREVLTYQARLRLPSNTTPRGIREKVLTVLDLLDLMPIKDTIIGSVEKRVLSGGQRKRVNIGMELVADPNIMLLDEPTSGLDSASSLAVWKALQFLAEKSSMTIAAVIHQPRSEIFSMMHSVILLSTNGRTVYQGKPDEMTKYFEQLGYSLPVGVNPADFVVDVVSGVRWRGQSLSEEPATIASAYELTDIADDTEPHDTDNVEEAGAGSPSMRKETAGFFTQFWAFLNREFILQARSINTVIVNYALTILAGAVLGATYKEVDFKKFLLMSSMSALIVGLICCILSLRCFNSHPAVFKREALSGVNLVSYYLAVNTSQFPHLVLLPLAYLSLNYTLAFPRLSFSAYYLVTLVAYFNVSGFVYVISIVLSRKNAQMTSVVFVLASTLLSGLTPRLCELDNLPVVGPALYSISYSKWFVEALFEKEQALVPPAFKLRVFQRIFSCRGLNFCLDENRKIRHVKEVRKEEKTWSVNTKDVVAKFGFAERKDQMKSNSKQSDQNRCMAQSGVHHHVATISAERRMTSEKLTKEVDTLSNELISLPTNMRLFSLSMRSLFTDQAVGGQSDTAIKVRQLRDNTRNDAVAYLTCVLPIVTRRVAGIGDYFEYYEALTKDEWWESIEDIIEETKAHKEACKVLVKIHEDMLTTLKKRKDEASVLVIEMKDLTAEYEKKVQDLKGSANAKTGWAIGLAFIPIVNLIATPILLCEAQKDLAEATAAQKETEIQYAVSRVVADVLVPALGNFIDGLQQIAGFFEVIHQELRSFQQKGERAAEGERPKLLHYKTMKLKAKEIRGGCRGFYAVLPSVRTDLLAIPNEGTDQNYVDRWLEKQKKTITENCSVKSLAAKMIKAITSSDNKAGKDEAVQ
eukprot:gene17325-19058_t